jgi:hypothetical protein
MGIAFISTWSRGGIHIQILESLIYPTVTIRWELHSYKHGVVVGFIYKYWDH